MGVIHTRDKQGSSASPEPCALPAEQTKLYLLRAGARQELGKKMVSGLVLVSYKGMDLEV